MGESRRRIRWRTLAAAVLALPACAPATAEAATAGIRDSYDPRAGQTNQSVIYTAAPGEANDLQVSAGEREVRLRDAAGITPGRLCSRPDPADRTLVVCTFTSPEGFASVGSISLGDRDDRAVVTEGGVPLEGGPGNDTLRAGPLGSSLTGGPGNDDLAGGAGRDVFDEGGAANGSDTLRGGAEEDSVQYESRRRGVRVDFDGARDDGERGERDLVSEMEAVTGGRGDDRLSGGDGPDELSGGAGSDVLLGRGGNDSLEGRSNGTGASLTRDRDRLDGGGGHDSLYAGDGKRVALRGGPGQDLLSGGSGRNSIRAADGEADRVECFRGRDRVAADALDFVASERGEVPGRCERIRRRGAAAAVLASAGPQFVNTVTPFRTIELEIGCSGDGPRRCSGTAEFLLDGRRHFRASFRRVRRGRDKRLLLPTPQPLRERVGREGEVTLEAVVRSRDRRGRPTTRRRPLILTSDIEPIG